MKFEFTPFAFGGLNLNRFGVSAAILIAIVICIYCAYRPTMKNI
jgi:ABC-type uncharacterized transport system permease subunit